MIRNMLKLIDLLVVVFIIVGTFYILLDMNKVPNSCRTVPDVMPLTGQFEDLV